MQAGVTADGRKFIVQRSIQQSMPECRRSALSSEHRRATAIRSSAYYELGAGRRRVDISRATEIDLDGIMELQTANQPERGGTLSASLPRSRIAKMMRAM